MLSVTAKGRNIPALAEEEWCEVVELENPTAIRAHFLRFTIDDGLSHHAIVQLVTPQSPWNLAGAGFQFKGGGCSAPGDDSSPVLIGTQRAVLEFSFPPGVYFPIGARQKLLLNYHYINLRSAPARTNIRLDIGHGDASRTIQAGTLFYNWTSFSSIAPGTTSTQAKTCRSFATPKTVFTLNGHQHQLGSRFEVFTIRGGAETKVYENLDWDNPLYRVYDPPLQLLAGDQIKFACTWRNTSGASVRFGTSKDDEMCILGGYIYPATDLTVTCDEAP